VLVRVLLSVILRVKVFRAEARREEGHYQRCR
jgi:hypothetical protein